MVSGSTIAGDNFDKDVYKIAKVASKIIRDQKGRIISQDFQDYGLIIILHIYTHTYSHMHTLTHGINLYGLKMLIKGQK